MAASGPTKIAWKLQEFVAHASNVTCLVLGKHSGRLLATGGDDCRVNLWSVSKPNCIMSLTGHNTPVECIQFKDTEELVVAGSQSGSLRIWDLEAAKILRTLSGHKANVCSLDFHPYGEFVASGSMDTNIKLWDIRRKGCVMTYKGQSNAVRCLRFSPDGRWIASAGDDGIVKLWDLSAAKVLTEFREHTGPVNIVEFHPNEYLLASGSSDRTIKFWDLEKFKMVSCTEVENSPIRCILFSMDGCCLYSGSQDSLHVYGWEPPRCFDVVPVNWSKVSDLSTCSNQLIGASCSQMTVSTFVVDLNRVKKSGSIVQGEIEDEKLFNLLTPKGAALRRNYERPLTTCSRPQSKVKEEPESEQRSPSGEEDKDDKESTAEIRNPEEYKEIFQPKSAIARTPPRRNDPFPAPPEDDNVPLLKEVEKVNPASEMQSAAMKRAQPQKNNKLADLTDEDAVSQIRKGHDTMCVILTSRFKNLDMVRAMWTTGDVKTSIDSAVTMNDLAVMVDILNIINLKPALWKLDLCSSIIPQIEKLLQSKYESYVQTGCMSLKLILQRFGPLIADNLVTPPSIGVDITREERQHKCKLCYKQLKNLVPILQSKAGLAGRQGSAFRELQLLMASFE
ncbi:katanin p80 WD40 repeat-containing subunit B1 isoform X2 [Callorhinchus milii]|uniref:katanin p80 WD40 repeat-containing subunit B1 isoform X2 n=1 Tax=Callorhinchus milii TaxID=7868 RepID=UPI00045716E2|nr:katanin p80 WD40 repeat-containing subunit B1 isoform X2 [Callorhinchus milii]|eukprot:gi/632972830/ref/XP_007902854.1/ PREDICTED: katanin p80 WD40 repeat-containing subunit B1 isoform X3 [Callorhinchus milii]